MVRAQWSAMLSTRGGFGIVSGVCGFAELMSVM